MPSQVRSADETHAVLSHSTTVIFTVDAMVRTRSAMASVAATPIYPCFKAGRERSKEILCLWGGAKSDVCVGRERGGGGLVEVGHHATRALWVGVLGP